MRKKRLEEGKLKKREALSTQKALIFWAMWHFKLTVWVNSWQNAAYVAKVGSKEITKVLCSRSRNLELFSKREALVNSTTNLLLMSFWDTLLVYMKVLIVCILMVLIVSSPRLSQILKNLDGKEDLCLVDEGPGENITVLSDTSFRLFERFSGVSVMLTTQTETWGNDANLLESARDRPHTQLKFPSSTEMRFCDSLLLIWGNALERIMG